MKRSLRILRWAASLVGVMGVILFGVLSVRSYWWSDDLIIPLPGPRSLIIHSLYGTTAWQWRPRPPDYHQSFAFESLSAAVVMDGLDPLFERNLRAIELTLEGVDILVMPHWLWMLFFAIVGVSPWLRWRFSVRGVLVLMAFIAAMFAILIFE